MPTNQPPALQPSSIRKLHETAFLIKWTNGQETYHDAIELRKSCPCAFCAKYPPSLKRLQAHKVHPVDIQTMGRYALRITFSDGHRSGIYTYKRLLKAPK